ncbi:DUF4386 domain-containing protein [Streptomyces sp. NPDC049954]|uniref:DUF4386 domain-containing protein n=1 Tax=Streptomyces sp. NPDC049954 TaxID=3155779 RepID=UPI00342D5F8D
MSRSIPQPTASAATTLAYFQDHATATKVTATLQLGASVPLAIWSAIVYHRLRLLRVSAPGPGIGLAGGIIASASLGLCGLLGWATARSADLHNAAVTRTMADLMFMTGGPGHIVAFGLLLAGVAVPIAMTPVGPRTFGLIGIALAVVAEVGTLTLLNTNFGVALPIARFGGLLWLVIASIILSTKRQRATSP